MDNMNLMTPEEVQAFLMGGSRPILVNQKTGKVQIKTKRGLMVNSLLHKDEWIEVDRAVNEAARYPLRAVQDLRQRGLTVRLGGLGSLSTSWYNSSEITAAVVNMTGQGGGQRDLPELKQVQVPVPVIFKECAIDQRSLLASRNQGDGLDMTSIVEATRVVAEQTESLLVNGASLKLNGQSLYGYRTHPNRNTGSAAGDFGTIANITTTFNAIIADLNADRHYGPFVFYLSTDQYNETTNQYYTDGSGNTPLQRVRAMPQVEDVRMLPPDILPSGEIIAVQMDRTVVEWAEAIGIQIVEWTTDDGMGTMFKVMTVATPRVKAHYGGQCGIAHYTGA